MRDRLVAAFVGLTVVVIALYGVPRAYFLAELVSDSAQRSAERAVELVVAVVHEREQAGGTVDEQLLGSLVGPGESVEHVAADGTRTRGGILEGSDPDDVVVRAPVPGGGDVTLVRAGEVVDAQVSDALLPLVLIGLALVAASTVAGFLLARRLSRPFRELADAAADLGTGRLDTRIPRYRVPEADAIGIALTASAQDLGELLRREREFAVSASHRLRTPITALRLELEDLALWPQTTPEVAAELERSLTELDRLSAAVTSLLDGAKEQRMEDAVETDVRALVEASVRAWRERGVCAGREVALEAGDAVVVRLTPAPVRRVVEALLDNACRHGRGRVSVSTVDLADRVRISVTDEGARPDDAVVFPRRAADPAATSGSRGLALARERAEALGGQLTLDPAPLTTFVLLLPRA